MALGLETRKAVRPTYVEALIARLRLTKGGLPSADAQRLRTETRATERYGPGEQVQSPDLYDHRVVAIVSGWAWEGRLLMDGRRQIFSFLLPGDTVVLCRNSDLSKRAVVAINKLTLADITRQLKAGDTPALQRACTNAAAIQSERLFDHIVRLGRQSAYERVAHLMLELRDRLTEVGLATGESFQVPLTQELMGDALGLSIVHVNRTLQQLRRQGLIEMKSGGVTLLNMAALSAIAGGSPTTQPRRPSQSNSVTAASMDRQPTYS